MPDRSRRAQLIVAALAASSILTVGLGSSPVSAAVTVDAGGVVGHIGVDPAPGPTPRCSGGTPRVG